MGSNPHRYPDPETSRNSSSRLKIFTPSTRPKGKKLPKGRFALPAVGRPLWSVLSCACCRLSGPWLWPLGSKESDGDRLTSDFPVLTPESDLSRRRVLSLAPLEGPLCGPFPLESLLSLAINLRKGATFFNLNSGLVVLKLMMGSIQKTNMFWRVLFFF